MNFSIKSLAILSLLTIVVSGAAAIKGGYREGSALRTTPNGRSLGGKKGHHSKGHPGHHELFLDIKLAEGETEIVLKNGPMLVFAACNENGTSLVLNMQSDEELLVFGDTSEENNLEDPPLESQKLPAGTLFARDLWAQSTDDQGNDTNDGAVWANGYYIGWNGDSTIGIHRTNAADLSLAGDNVNCILSGLLYYAHPDDC